MLSVRVGTGTLAFKRVVQRSYASCLRLYTGVDAWDLNLCRDSVVCLDCDPLTPPAPQEQQFGKYTSIETGHALYVCMYFAVFLELL